MYTQLQYNATETKTITTATPAYGTQTRVPINMGQILTFSIVSLISTVELSFFSMV